MINTIILIKNTCKNIHKAKVAHLSSTYLLQQDVLVDDSLVPLRVSALATMFGPPLVLSTVGDGVGWGGERVGEEKKGRRWGDTKVKNSSSQTCRSDW